jgi:hypothetical protein
MPPHHRAFVDTGQQPAQGSSASPSSLRPTRTPPPRPIANYEGEQGGESSTSTKGKGRAVYSLDHHADMERQPSSQKGRQRAGSGTTVGDDSAQRVHSEGTAPTSNDGAVHGTGPFATVSRSSIVDSSQRPSPIGTLSSSSSSPPRRDLDSHPTHSSVPTSPSFPCSPPPIQLGTIRRDDPFLPRRTPFPRPSNLDAQRLSSPRSSFVFQSR